MRAQRALFPTLLHASQCPFPKLDLSLLGLPFTEVYKNDQKSLAIISQVAAFIQSSSCLQDALKP